MISICQLGKTFKRVEGLIAMAMLLLPKKLQKLWKRKLVDKIISMMMMYLKVKESIKMGMLLLLKKLQELLKKRVIMKYLKQNKISTALKKSQKPTNLRKLMNQIMTTKMTTKTTLGHILSVLLPK